MKYKTKSLIEKNIKNYLQNTDPERTIKSKIKNHSEIKMRHMERSAVNFVMVSGTSFIVNDVPLAPRLPM